MAVGGLVLQPIPGVELRVSGDAPALRHFSAEYGAAALIEPTPAVARLDVRFVRGLEDGPRDRHKSVSWRARLARADSGLELQIDLRGMPRWFGLSLVQGYVVEPVLSLLAVETDSVLLPAAGIGPVDGITLLIGRSRTGKSSLSLRALAAGVPILGDDQVAVTRGGRAIGFPRRLRVYDDLRATAPAAIERLPASTRFALWLRRVIRLASAGTVAPSLAIPAERFGVASPGAGQIARVVLLRRNGHVGDEPVLQPAGPKDAVAAAADALSAQRARLRHAIGPGWDQSVNTAAAAEAVILGQAFASVEIVSLTIPAALSAEAAVPAVARLLNLP